ncbi:MAG: CpaF family protein [Clostridia bacterium]|jgi:pilus assembly protein CpaF
MSLMDRLERLKQEEREVVIEPAPVPRTEDHLKKVKEIALQRVVSQLAEEYNPTELTNETLAQVRVSIQELVNSVLVEEGKFASRSERIRMIDEILNEIIGYGPIDPLIKDPTISEIMVNGYSNVYIERNGKIERTSISFRNDEHVIHVIDKILAPLGRRVDETSPMVDARLPDGSRVNVIIPPLAVKGPTITIRKFATDPYNVDNLIGFGTLTYEMAEFLKACVQARLNILVSGGTGSGKTTTLNVLSSFIPPEERIVTIEDAAELQLHQEHVVTLEARPANIEGKGRVTIRDLVINALRMRPDRIVVGEVRGGEALDMLQAMNTGHDGSITTAHANSPRDSLARLETMVLMAGMDLPVRAIREQISSAIHIIVHQSRFRDGSRKITQITEVTGMEGDVVSLQDIFVFEQTGVDDRNRVIGRFRPTGIIPKAMATFKPRGIHLPSQIFVDKEGIQRRR